MHPGKRNTDLWTLGNFMEEVVLVLGLRGSRLELGLEENYRVWMCGCDGKMAPSGMFILGKGKREGLSEV